MRDGIKGWKNAGYATVGRPELLNDLIVVNKTDFATLIITENEARNLKNCTFVDFRDVSKYNQSHVKDANHVDYGNMFSKPMMEELNKCSSLAGHELYGALRGALHSEEKRWAPDAAKNPHD